MKEKSVIYTYALKMYTRNAEPPLIQARDLDFAVESFGVLQDATLSKVHPAAPTEAGFSLALWLNRL
jgi:hypothetical protein